MTIRLTLDVKRYAGFCTQDLALFARDTHFDGASRTPRPRNTDRCEQTMAIWRFEPRHEPRTRRGVLGGLLAAILALAGCGPAEVRPQWVYFPQPPDPPRVVHVISFNRLNELAPPAVSWVEALRGIQPGPWVGTPSGIAWGSDALYICDIHSNHVQVWPMDGSGRARWLGGEGELRKPVGVAVDDGGTVFVADSEAGRVSAFTPAGQLSHRYRPPGERDYRPVAVAVRGGELYVADQAGQCIDVYSTATRGLLRSFGRPGTGPGELYYPAGVAVGDTGRVYVSDTLNGRVQVFDAQGSFISSIGRRGDRPALMGQPKGIALAPGGVVIVADAALQHVHLFNGDGRLLLLLGGPHDNPGGTPLPNGVAVSPRFPDSLRPLLPPDFHADYAVWVSDTTGTQRLSLFAVGERSSNIASP